LDLSFARSDPFGAVNELQAVELALNEHFGSNCCCGSNFESSARRSETCS